MDSGLVRGTIYSLSSSAGPQNLQTKSKVVKSKISVRNTYVMISIVNKGTS